MTITLITGANKGLGYETARRLLASGHTVYLGARNPEKGEAAADALGASFVQLDVTDDASVAAAADTVRASEGHLDVLINNAGILGPRVATVDTTSGDIRTVFDTNVFGIVRTMRAFVPLLEKSANPVVVNVSSGLGSFSEWADPDSIAHSFPNATYNPSKSAVTMLTVQYAAALPGMRVNVADPGYTATDFNGHRGTQTVEEGTDAIVRLATLGADGPTGTFQDRDGIHGW